MTLSMQRRLLSLEPWLVRALIPPGLVGTYLLYKGGYPIYAGRSDRDLRRRLISHAYNNRADYFEFDVHADSKQAYDVECALYHTLEGHTTNLIHPASPACTDLECFICNAVVT